MKKSTVIPIKADLKAIINGIISYEAEHNYEKISYMICSQTVYDIICRTCLIEEKSDKAYSQGFWVNTSRQIGGIIHQDSTHDFYILICKEFAYDQIDFK